MHNEAPMIYVASYYYENKLEIATSRRTNEVQNLPIIALEKSTAVRSSGIMTGQIG